MKNMYIILISSLISTIILFAQTTLDHKITSASIWKPSEATIQKIYTDCGAQQGDNMYDCLLNEMSASGASSQALDFAAQLNGHGYMNDFKPLGEIDAAYIYFVFRSPNKEGCLLVNCSPNLMDVDDVDLLPIGDLKQNITYKELEKSYPNITLFPGDRLGTDYPHKLDLPNHGEEIIINYNLRNGCYDCQLLGYTEFAFNFDSTGKFMGIKFVSIKKSMDLKAPETTETPQNVFSDPSAPIDVYLGDKFSIAIQSNHSAGLKWELAVQPDVQMLNLLGTNFVQSYETLPNAAGKEIWTFLTVGSGYTILKLNYVPAWNPGSVPLQTITFKVNIK